MTVHTVMELVSFKSKDAASSKCHQTFSSVQITLCNRGLVKNHFHSVNCDPACTGGKLGLDSEFTVIFL